VQETFLAFLRAPVAFDPAKGTLAGYSFGIARHHEVKRLARQGVALLETPDAKAIVATPADDTPFAFVARNEMTIGRIRTRRSAWSGQRKIRYATLGFPLLSPSQGTTRRTHPQRRDPLALLTRAAVPPG